MAVELAERETVAVQFVLHGLLVKIGVTPVGNPDAIEKVRDMFVKEIAVIVDDKLPPPWTSVTLVRMGGNRIKSGSTAFTGPISRTGKIWPSSWETGEVRPENIVATSMIMVRDLIVVERGHLILDLLP